MTAMTRVSLCPEISKCLSTTLMKSSRLNSPHLLLERRTAGLRTAQTSMSLTSPLTCKPSGRPRAHLESRKITTPKTNIAASAVQDISRTIASIGPIARGTKSSTSSRTSGIGSITIPSMRKPYMGVAVVALGPFRIRLPTSRGSRQIQEPLTHGGASRTPRYLASASPKNPLHLKARHLVPRRTKGRRKAQRVPLPLLLLLPGVTLRIPTQRAVIMMSTGRSMMRKTMSPQ